MTLGADTRFMAMALREAEKARDKGEVPVGALVVRGEQVIAQAHNLREATQSPVDHAEIIALRKASQFLGSWRLLDCCLYVTLEPCVMCAGATVQSRIHRLVYAARDPKGGGMASLSAIGSDSRLNHQVQIHQLKAMEAPSASLLREFFQQRRRKVATDDLQ